MRRIKIESCVLAEIEGDKINAMWCPFFRADGEGGSGERCLFHKDAGGYYGKPIPFEIINADVDKPEWCKVMSVDVNEPKAGP